MGSIRARQDNGLLFFDFRLDGKRRREQTLLADTPANRKRLEKALSKIEADIEAGTFDYSATFPKSRSTHLVKGQSPSTTAPLPATPIALAAAESEAPATPSFREFTAQWLADHQVEWRRSHIKVLNSTLEGHLLPEFGDKPVAAITKADILAFRAKLAVLPGRARETMSNKRINGILAPLRQILNDAAERFVFVSPATGLKPLRIRKTDVEPFTLDQVQQLLAVVRPDYREYFTVRFLTGMRTGECHGLKWKYIDFENRLILIRETFVLGEDEYTKTDSSQRDIQMNQVVFEALKRQFDATGKVSDYVFCNAEGKPLDNKNFTDRVWQPLLRHLGLKLRRPYQMRHTAATLWLASGEAPEWIARQLGHSSTEMLFRVYSRFVPNLTRRDGSAIDRLLATRFASGRGNAGEAGPASASSSFSPEAEKRPPAQPPPVSALLAA
jgi:integrase